MLRSLTQRVRQSRLHRLQLGLGALTLGTTAGIMPYPAAAGDAIEAAYLGELPVVLSASRLAQPTRSAPGAVTVIDRDQIRASGARSIAELLRLVPGLQIGHFNGYLPLTTYHGLADEAPRRMLVRIDGRSAYSPYFVSGIEWHKLTVDLDDIERIEVFRGTNTVAYGSQAFMGVVNIITRPAADTPRLRLRLRQGDNGVAERSASIGQHLGEAALRLSVADEGDHGVHGLADDWRKQRADLHLDWQLAADQRLELRAGSMHLRGGLGEADSPTNPERKQTSRANFGQVRWHWQRGPAEELSVAYFHQEESMRDAFVLAPLRDLLIPMLMAAQSLSRDAAGAIIDGLFERDASALFDYDNRVVRDDIELEHILAPRADLRLVWGLGHREDRLRAPGLFAGRGSLGYRTSRLFGNLEWQLSERWLVNAGATVEDGSYTTALVSPRLALNYALDARHTVRAAVSRAYRRPIPFERSADTRYHETLSGLLLRQTYQPAPDLDPEQVSVRELGYLGEFAALRTSVDLRLFEERVGDLIDFDAMAVDGPQRPLLDDRARKAGNRGRATLRGAELAVMWRPAARTWLGVNYSRLDIDSADPRLRDSAPRAMWSLLAAWSPAPDWQLSLNHHRVGEMGWQRGPSGLLPAYRITSLRAAHRFDIGGTRNEFALTLSNTGPRHADFLPEQHSGPVAYATLRIEL